MSIDVQLSESAPESPTTNPAAPVSDAIVNMLGPGGVRLETKTPSGEWVAVTNQTGAFAVSTPDSGLEYRFVLQGEGPADVYLGP